MLCLVAVGLVGMPAVAMAAPIYTSSAPAAGVVGAPGTAGYWIVASDGGVFTFGGAPFFGSMGGQRLASPVVGMAATPSGRGYWLVAKDGGIFAFGDAQFHGSMGGKPLNKPVVGMAATRDGGGYWLVGADGGIFAFGNAGFHGSMGGKALNSPMVGMARSATGAGYWLVASDGGIFAFGDAVFGGSMGGQPLNAGVVGIAGTGTSNGYWFVGSDGGVFAYGGAVYQGRVSYTPPPPAVTGTDTRAKIVNVARGQLGTRESGADCNPYGPCVAWCSLFATWAWKQAGIAIDRYPYSGDIYDKWGKPKGRAISGTVGMKPGDAVLYNYGDGGLPSDHVDVVETVNANGSITVIGGNVSNAVTRRTISLAGSRIYGYVRPV
jgi:hypothetical protein